MKSTASEPGLMSYMYGIGGVSYFCGKTACQKYFFQIVSKKTKTLSCDSQKSRFGVDPKNPPRVWTLWIHDPFLDLPQKRKIQFWTWKSGFRFSPKNAPTNSIFSSSSDASTYFLFLI